MISELPDPAPGGGLTFSFATAKYTKQGGAVKQQAYSQRPGDAFFLQKPAVADGMLELTGQLGSGKGSSWATLGAVWDVQPRGMPFNASKFRNVTVRLASTTRFLRLRMVGDDKAVAETGCYPVYQQEVTEVPTDYTIPLSKFALEPQCAATGREIGETLPRLMGIEVTSTRITERPIKIWIGPTTLRP